MPPLLPIPDDANWFYVSDAATIFIGNPGTTDVWDYPGVFNQSGAVLPSQTATIWIKSASFQVTAVNASDDHGINVDLICGLYDISQPQAAWSVPAAYIPPYGSPAPPGFVLNHNMKRNQSSWASRRDFGKMTPLVLGVTAPNSGTAFQVGAGIHFSYDIGSLIQYTYHIHGAWKVG